MKILLLAFLCLCYGLGLKAAVKVFQPTTGLWSTASNWLPAGVPADGDEVQIPSGKTCNIEGDVYGTAPILQIKIYGTLRFNNSSAELNLGTGSNIEVFTGGAISRANNSSNILGSIGGAAVYTSSNTTNPLTGPVYAVTSPTPGFTPGTLAIKINSFTAQVIDNFIQVNYAVAVTNAYTVTLETSTDGVLWQTETSWNNVASQQYRFSTTQKYLFVRLKITENNTIQYSKVLRVALAPMEKIDIKKIGESIFINTTALNNENISYYVFNTTGQVIDAKQQQGNGVVTVPITNQYPNSFYIKVVAGSNSKTQGFIR
jgi:hypothetical protein